MISLLKRARERMRDQNMISLLKRERERETKKKRKAERDIHKDKRCI